MSRDSDQLRQEFETFFTDYNDAIFRHCFFKVRDRELAKDLTQESFVRLWQCLEKGDQIDNVRAFLYKIAGNLVIDHVRKKKSVSLDALAEEGFEPGQDDLPAIQNRLDMESALVILEKVPEPYRQALVLRYVEDLDPAEIAAITGETANVISVRIHRGLEKLRSFLPKHG